MKRETSRISRREFIENTGSAAVAALDVAEVLQPICDEINERCGTNEKPGQ